MEFLQLVTEAQGRKGEKAKKKSKSGENEWTEREEHKRITNTPI
jgi:hypothetical protein